MFFFFSEQIPRAKNAKPRAHVHSSIRIYILTKYSRYGRFQRLPSPARPTTTFNGRTGADELNANSSANVELSKPSVLKYNIAGKCDSVNTRYLISQRTLGVWADDFFRGGRRRPVFLGAFVRIVYLCLIVVRTMHHRVVNIFSRISQSSH